MRVVVVVAGAGVEVGMSVESWVCEWFLGVWMSTLVVVVVEFLGWLHRSQVWKSTFDACLKT